MARSKQSKKIVISPQAKEDVSAILHYLSKNWNQKTIEEFLEKLETFYYIVSVHPQIFGYYNKHKGIRKYALTKQNIVFYRIKKGMVEVITVFDSRQNPAKLKKRLR